MRHRSSSTAPSTSPPHHPHHYSMDLQAPDFTSLLSDELLLQVLSKLPTSQCLTNSLVCKRWLLLHGRLVRELKLVDWSFLNSGRIFHRFPNLADLDIVRACIRKSRNSGIVVSHKSLCVSVDAEFSDSLFVGGNDVLSSDLVDYGLEMIAENYPSIRRIAAIGASENGLVTIASKCETIQEMELHCCGDMSLKGISTCKNLQVLKLVGCVNGFYRSVVSDIGLTILAQRCRRLVKLELCGCEGSYDGVKAIGQCCEMLEELTLNDHRMDSGWLSALSFCGNLKTLRLRSCKSIDSNPGLEEHLGCCFALEELYLEQCQTREKQGVKALFGVCASVRELVFQDCWGLEDDVFDLASVCRRVKLLSLEGCSLLTTAGLEAVIDKWKELERLKVTSCNKIKDAEVTPALASLFSDLKELKWRPDTRSLLLLSLEGTGVGNKGARFFRGLKS